LYRWINSILLLVSLSDLFSLDDKLVEPELLNVLVMLPRNLEA